MAIPTIIIPAILATNKEDFQKDLSNLLNSKNLSTGWVHIDFLDNIFVPNKSITPEDIEEIDFGNLKKEAHLMVKKPAEWIKKLKNFSRIIIHVETATKEDIFTIKESGIEVGLAINPETPLDKLDPFIKYIDTILVMGVHPGFQGQSFIPETLNKIREIKNKYPASRQGGNIKIEVDGAVKDTNAKDIVDSGCDILISGSFLINGNPDENLARLTKTL